MTRHYNEQSVEPPITAKYDKTEQVIDYIAQMLTELSDMASGIGHTELSDLIRFSGRAALMEKTKLGTLE